jgi:hypothetical protein
MSSPGQANADVVAQQAVVDAAYATWQASLVTLQNLKQVLKQSMITAGIQEGDKNDPRPLASR